MLIVVTEVMVKDNTRNFTDHFFAGFLKIVKTWLAHFSYTNDKNISQGQE